MDQEKIGKFISKNRKRKNLTQSELAEKLGVKTGAVMWCIRIAVSGMSATPGGATEIMEVIGRAETDRRIDTALSKLN